MNKKFERDELELFKAELKELLAKYDVMLSMDYGDTQANTHELFEVGNEFGTFFTLAESSYLEASNL